MKKQSIKLLLISVFVFALTLCPVFTPQSIFAAAPLKLEKTSVTLDHVYYDDEEDWITYEEIYITDDSCSIQKVEVSKDAKKIIKVENDSDSITIYGMAKGTCKFNVIGVGGTQEVTVTVTQNYMNEKLGANTYIYNDWYGSGKVKIISWGAVNVKMTVAGDTYTVKAPETGVVYIPLKKVYKLNTKSKFEISKGSNKATKYSYFYNDTSIEKASAKKKTIKVKFYNLHKGDILKLKYRGKVYTKKVKKNYNGKYKAVAFKVKSKVKAKKKFSVKVTNKYKQPMFKAVFQMKKGTSDCKYLASREY